jgi:hypothetical protein
MKFTVIILLISFSALAQMPKMPKVMPGLKDVSKQVMEACKEDQSKIKGCEAYTDLSKLKVCLMENKEKLSSKCKQALQLVK